LRYTKPTLVQEIRFDQDCRTLKAVQRDRLRQIAAATDGNEVPARIMTALETMAAFIAENMRGCVPAATRTTARLHAIDAVGAWIAGAHTVEGQALIAFRGPAPDLATACAVTRSSEIDAIHLASTTTPGGIIIPAALVIATLRGETDTAAVAEAIIAGTEAMVRLGAAIGGPGILYRGIWPTYFAAPFGVAAVAARLYELDARQTANALALGFALASAGVGHHNAATTARWFAIGNAARSGLTAAQAASRGFTSDLGLLDGGFLQGAYGITPDIAAFTANLGEEFALDQTSFKPWCGARQTMAATQALREAMIDGVAPGSIASITVHVPPPTLKMIDHAVRPGDRASHLTSVQYHLALAACDPAALMDVGHSPAVLTPDIQDFMRKVRVVADAALLAHYPKAWPARIALHTPQGMREHTVVHVPGDPQRPFDERDICDKFRHITARLDAASAARLLERCRAAFEARRWPPDLLTEIMQAEMHRVAAP
jgi:2-methylcitrate dehydratase PrpD